MVYKSAESKPFDYIFLNDIDFGRWVTSSNQTENTDGTTYNKIHCQPTDG